MTLISSVDMLAHFPHSSFSTRNGRYTRFPSLITSLLTSIQDVEYGGVEVCHCFTTVHFGLLIYNNHRDIGVCSTPSKLSIPLSTIGSSQISATSRTLKNIVIPTC